MNALLGLCSPTRFAVVHVPLVHQGNDTLICTTRHDRVLRLRVGDGQPSFYQLRANFWFGILDRFPFEVTDDHGTTVETLFVRDLLCICERIGVFGRLDLQLFANLDSGEVPVFGGLDDGNRCKVQPFRIHFVVLGLFTQFFRRRVIVW